ncbi:hypothetical protein J2809_004207 [Arthrobacter pascens]|uniref:hypothetical protein n=1 Tax=Arthrobacter pascens TaxID=1677 RepID=UPI0028579F14|nr:hypothetical protein [Arthrobacter pascens]MDR6559824.1 hypothetical protein [Arthrobacter pascens]
MADEKPTSWWSTLPGLLTAVAAVIGAVTGLLVALGQLGVIDFSRSDPLSSSGAPSHSQPPRTTALEPTPTTETPSPPANAPVNAEVRWSEVDFGSILGKGRLYVKPPQGPAGKNFEVGGRGFPSLYVFLIRHLSLGTTDVTTDTSGSFTMTLTTEPTLCQEYTIEILELSTLKLFGKTTYTTTGC